MMLGYRPMVRLGPAPGKAAREKRRPPTRRGGPSSARFRQEGPRIAAGPAPDKAGQAASPTPASARASAASASCCSRGRAAKLRASSIICRCRAVGRAGPPEPSPS